MSPQSVRRFLIELIGHGACRRPSWGSFLYRRKHHLTVRTYHQALVTVLRRERSGAFCWGKYIFVDKAEPTLLRHEYGHTLQSFILGPLYIPVIWIPSAYNLRRIRSIDSARYAEAYQNYWTRFPENWADKLGGVTRH